MGYGNRRREKDKAGALASNTLTLDEAWESIGLIQHILLLRETSGILV